MGELKIYGLFMTLVDTMLHAPCLFRITVYPLVSDGELEKPSLMWWLVFDCILFFAGFLALIVRIIFPSLLADHVAQLPKTLNTITGYQKKFHPSRFFPAKAGTHVKNPPCQPRHPKFFIPNFFFGFSHLTINCIRGRDA